MVMSMKSKSNDIAITRGDTEGILIKFNDYKPTADDKFELTVRKSIQSPDKSLHKVGQLMEDGTVLIKIDPSDTSGLDFGQYVYDVQATFGSGEVKTIIKPAKFFVGGEVTYD